MSIQLCPTCGGTGVDGDFVCGTCSGYGQVSGQDPDDDGDD